MEILNMLNLRVVVAWFTDDGDDVKTKGRVDVLVVEVIGDGLQKVELFLAIYGSDGVGEVTTFAGLHFYEDDGVVLLGNDVNVAMAVTPVTFQYDIAFLPQVGSSESFSPCTSLQVLGTFV